MAREGKYHKIISLVLLLFLVITIQHYSNKAIRKIFHPQDQTAPVEVTQLFVPSFFSTIFLPHAEKGDRNCRTASEYSTVLLRGLTAECTQTIAQPSD